MYLENVIIENFRSFKNAELSLVSSDSSKCFALASPNGGGKSTLLQLIFILLHCYKNEEKHKYILQVLSDEEFNNNDYIAKFKLNIEGSEHFLNFKVVTSNEELDFSIFDDLDQIDRHIATLPVAPKALLVELLALENAIDPKKRLDPLTLRRFHQYKNEINIDDRELYSRAIEDRDSVAALNLLNKLIESHKESHARLKELEQIKASINYKISSLNSYLSNSNLEHVFNFYNGQALVVESNLSEEQSELIEDHIYLSAPSSQVFSFLDDEEKETILSLYSEDSFNFSEDNYSKFVEIAKDELEGFYTYDFTTTELISNSFEKAFSDDKRAKINNGSYGNHYDLLVEELNNFLEGKVISQDVRTSEIVFKLNNGKTLRPEDLSHGELKKLSLYAWLKHIVKPESIVLIDELDIALHPKWQEEILNDFSKWEPSNEYIVATHSPQILNSVHYKNLRFLECINGDTSINNSPDAPVDRDTNSMIEIMGANSFPKDLLKLHQLYRKTVEDGTYKSEEGLKLRAEILEFESKDSLFLQDVQYDIDVYEE